MERVTAFRLVSRQELRTLRAVPVRSVRHPVWPLIGAALCAAIAWEYAFAAVVAVLCASAAVVEAIAFDYVQRNIRGNEVYGIARDVPKDVPRMQYHVAVPDVHGMVPASACLTIIRFRLGGNNRRSLPGEPFLENHARFHTGSYHWVDVERDGALFRLIDHKGERTALGTIEQVVEWAGKTRHAKTWKAMYAQ